MTTTVQEFTRDKLPVVTVSLSDSINDAAKLMIEYDYSQLPVVDSETKPLGIITSDSIIKALNNYGTGMSELRIKHVMQKSPRLFRQDIDLLDLFDDMDGSYAFVVNEEGKLVQIITSYDTAEYFSQRAKDTLLVENIENTLKDFIQLAFSSKPKGEAKLDQAIQSMTNSIHALREKFKKGIHNYLGRVSDKKSGNHVDEPLIDEIFSKYFDDQKPQATFDELTLGQYISLFLYNEHWSHFQAILELDKAAIEHLLIGVRDTRNDLSHFREIGRDQSRQLRDCYDLLTSHQQAITLAFRQDEPIIEKVTQIDEGKDLGGNINPLEDELAPGESKYAALAIWLLEQPQDRESFETTFATIEDIIGGKLPDSAYKHRAWWANDSVGHVQSREWLDVGWRVASVNMTTQTVRFTRIQNRQKAYIDFFSALDKELHDHPEFEHLQLLPDGSNWHYIKGVEVQGRNLAFWNFAFGRGGVLRVELYIDSGDQSLNKRIFDALFVEKESIENDIGYELLWQRLDHRKASRVSRVFKGKITDNDEALESLRMKAVPAMVTLNHFLEPKFKEISNRFL